MAGNDPKQVSRVLTRFKRTLVIWAISNAVPLDGHETEASSLFAHQPLNPLPPAFAA